jgi:hypothetical protein
VVEEMSESLLRLVYVSKATSTVDQDALQAILSNSSARNAIDGITGVLCASRDHYLQVLEGSAHPVLARYLRIASDPRHRDATLLGISLVTERLFGQWSMAFVDGSAHAADLHEMLLEQRNLGTRSDRAAAILRRFLAELKTRDVPDAAAAAHH